MNQRQIPQRIAGFLLNTQTMQLNVSCEKRTAHVGRKGGLECDNFEVWSLGNLKSFIYTPQAAHLVEKW